jgi:MtN3 and saliva related transmembrane protein
MHVGLHHAEKRKKQGKDDNLDRVMIVVGLMSPLSLLPQVIKIWTSQNVADISLISWILLTAVSVMWAIYGFVRHSKAIFISNIFLIVLNFLVVVAGILFR